MDRIEIVFLKQELNDLVPFIQEQGVLHLEDVPLAVENHPGFLHRIQPPREQQAELAMFQEYDAMLKELLPLLLVKPSHQAIAAAGPRVESWSPQLRERWIRLLHRRMRSLHRRRLNILDNMQLIKNYSRILQQIYPLLEQRHAVLGETARAMILEGYSAEALASLGNRFTEEVGKECVLITRELDRNTVVAVVTHAPGKGEKVSAVLHSEGIAPLDPPGGEHFGNTLVDVMRATGDRLQALQAKLDEVVEELRRYSQQYGDELTALSQLVSNRIRQLTVTDHFAQSEMVGVIHGWIPSESFAGFEAALKARFGGRAVVGKLSMEDIELEHVPTLRKNHPIFRPFEVMMSIMKPPTYGHFDPTPLVAVSFTFFYGLILGDIGYGLLILLIAWWAKRKWGHIPVAKDALTIFQYMGYSSIFFGVIFLEFFGDVIEHTFHIHPLFNRVTQSSTMLAITVAIGAVHVVLGLIIGIRENYKHHHHHHAEEKLGMLLGLFALVAAIGAGMLGSAAMAGYVAAGLLGAASLFYLVKSMGFMTPMGVIEVIGLTSNILSYARLTALGIAAIAFTQIANGMTRVESFALFLVLLIPAALIHAVNFGLSVFSPTIHSLRLNVVEFLPKFYNPAGRNYEPFRKDLVW